MRWATRDRTKCPLFAQVLPADKADFVEKLQREGGKVCFVGDGINDAIALKKSNVSISLRGATSIATDTAQVVFMEQSLGKLRDIAPGLVSQRHTSLGPTTKLVCATDPPVPRAPPEQ